MTEIDEVRAAFEAWHKDWHPYVPLNWRSAGFYDRVHVEGAWKAYQAAHAAGRRKGLEQAASELEKPENKTLHEWAKPGAIRALIEKEPT